MQLITLFLPLVALTSTVLADGAAITAAISTIQTKILDLSSTVADWAGPRDPLGTLPIIVKSTSLLAAINDGTKTARSSANLTLPETIGVAQSTISLVSSVQSTLSTIVAAEPKFAKLLLKPIIWLNLVTEKAATDKFSAAVISKVPVEQQALAESIVAPVATAFDAAIEAYE